MNYKIKFIDKKYNKKWIFFITLGAFFLALLFSFISEIITSKLNIYAAIINLIIIIFLGVVFDIIGVATTVADIGVFNSMAANRIKVASYAIKTIKNASKVSNFCSDVVGDIAGILSGAVGTIIVVTLVNIYKIKNAAYLTVLMSSIIASFTIGGKAWGKEIAINNSNEIVLLTSKFQELLHNKIGIVFMKEKK